jgi:uncharacterized cupin superfamily protein
MEISRIADAKRYDAPNHRGVNSWRIQERETTGTEGFWIGLSIVEPGGGAGPDAAPLEKVYVVLEGELTVVTGDDGEVILGKHDSCRIKPEETRMMRNNTTDAVTLLVIIPYPDAR